jgi:hypothetical protein
MGIHTIDQNTYRMPSANLLPLVVAVNKKHKDEGVPPFPWGSMDFVTDRNGLRKLIRWIVGGQVKDFRIDVQLAGRKTVLLNRWEKRTREPLSGRTYGFSFEKASTVQAAGCKESSGHHRIISYVREFCEGRHVQEFNHPFQDFNGLKMVVRYEVDACMPQPRSIRPKKAEPSLDSLADAMQNMNVTTTATVFSSNTMPALTIINGGNYVSQASTIELVTCSEHRRQDFNWKEGYPQLFLSQTNHHFLAVHFRGYFTSLEKKKLSSDFEDIHEEMRPVLKQLRKVLEIIQNIVVENDDSGRLSLVCSDGQLTVYKRKGQTNCLPEEGMSCFESKDA